MKTSEQINDLATAMATAQARMPAALMNAVNPFLNNRYADLGAVVDAIRIGIKDTGLSYVQFPATPPVEYGPAIALTTRIMHEGGQWLEDTFVMPMPAEERGKSMMQVTGSAISYARRYALASVFGVVSDQDADGNAPPTQRKAPARQPAAPAAKQPVAPPQGAAPANARSAQDVKTALVMAATDKPDAPAASEGQLKFARSSLSKVYGNDDAKLFLWYVFGLESSTNLSGPACSAIIDWVGATKENNYRATAAAAVEAKNLIDAAQKDTLNEDLFG